VGVAPHGDVGLALIGVVLLVRIIILPLSLSMVHTQKAMQVLTPKIKEIQEKYKNDKEVLAKETFALYKKYKVNPFASIFTLFIQLPILFTLYFIVRNKELYKVNAHILYSFVHIPPVLSPLFLGIFVISSPNIVLAIIAGATQFAYARWGMPLPAPAPKSSDGTPGSMQEEFGRAMMLQMRYVLPLFITFIAYTSGAIALYFITSNIVMLLQLGLANLTHTPLELEDEPKNAKRYKDKKKTIKDAKFKEKASQS
jgi:YidC/Oxa1 family membrane protein insertase